MRVYRNGSNLVSHADRSETHVVSAILHVAHDLDEPWPLEIEDHDGRVHALSLEPGQLVYYESAKQYHSRLTPMRGRHYGSLFLHWYPKHHWNWTMWDVHTAVPPGKHLDRGSNKAPGAKGMPKERKRIFDLGPAPLEAYYRKYWGDRGEGYVPPVRGIEKPVQSFSTEAFEKKRTKATVRGGKRAKKLSAWITGHTDEDDDGL